MILKVSSILFGVLAILLGCLAQTPPEMDDIHIDRDRADAEDAQDTVRNQLVNTLTVGRAKRVLDHAFNLINRQRIAKRSPRCTMNAEAYAMNLIRFMLDDPTFQYEDQSPDPSKREARDEDFELPKGTDVRARSIALKTKARIKNVPLVSSSIFR